MAPVLVAVLLIGALGFVAKQRQKAADATPPVVHASAPPPVQPDIKPADTPAPAPTPAVQEQPATAQETPHPAKKVKSSQTAPLAQPAPAPKQEASSPQPELPKMDPDVRRLLIQGKQQYANGKYGAAIASFRAVLQLQPNNQWAQRGIEACQQARQQQSEQILQSDQAQSQTDQNQTGARLHRRRPN